MDISDSSGVHIALPDLICHLLDLCVASKVHDMRHLRGSSCLVLERVDRKEEVGIGGSWSYLGDTLTVLTSEEDGP